MIQCFIAIHFKEVTKINIDRKIREKKRREELKKLEAQGAIVNSESLEENFEENLEEEQEQRAYYEKKILKRKSLKEIEELLERENKRINNKEPNITQEVGLDR